MKRFHSLSSGSQSSVAVSLPSNPPIILMIMVFVQTF